MNTGTPDGGGLGFYFKLLFTAKSGRRVSKTVAGSTTVFVCSGMRVIAEYTGGTPATNPTQKYVYGSYIDEPLLLDQSGTEYYYHSNHLFSVAAVSDATGTVVERYGYDAYGKVTILDGSASTILTSSSIGNPYLFTGRRLDEETGLYYYRARYYDSELGRFIGRDALGYVDGSSLYRGYFVPNGLDPFGENDWLGLGQGLSSANVFGGQVATYATTGNWVSPETITASGNDLISYGYTASLGVGQGGLNAANGVTDLPFDAANLAIMKYNTDYGWLLGEIEYIDKKRFDWSRDRLVDECDACHEWSKALGSSGPPVVTGAVLKATRLTILLKSSKTAKVAPTKLTGKFRGEPFAFGTGTRSKRALAMVEEAAKASNVRLVDVVDEVRYTQGNSYFDVDFTGCRRIYIGENAFWRNRTGQIIEATHELIHAQRYNNVLRGKGGNFLQAYDDYFLAKPFGSDLYALEEVTTELLALRRVERYLGGVSPQQQAATTRYINDWLSVLRGP